MSRLRHRELLLSLKASTVEACFSVPMLNLTIPSYPFVITFAVAALGWGSTAVGLMAALPHLCNLVQPVLATWLRQRMALHPIMVLTFIFTALPWGFVSALPFLPPSTHDLTFALILGVATLANSLGGVSWSAAIGELVPPRISCRFFSRRNLAFGFWTLLTVSIASQIAERGRNSLVVYGWIFAAAGLARLAGLVFLWRMKFPDSVMKPGVEPPAWAELWVPLRDRNYLKLAAFIGLWGLLLNLGQPFYPMFLLQVVQRPVGDVGWLTALAGIGGLLTLPGWGKLCDRFGVKPVLYVCSLAWAIVGLLSWTAAGNRWWFHLVGTYLFIGGTTAGFQLCQFHLMLKLAPANRAPYVAVFLALTSSLTAIGPILGGALLRLLPDQLGSFLGQEIRDYHVLFALSMFGCLVSVHLLDLVHEAEAHPPETVWRTMRSMRAFNPVLIAQSAAQLILTPVGLVALARQSVRTLRKQARQITDVGDDLVESTTEAIRPTRRDPPEKESP
jgi:Na+/melibiose symporter-like transporter